LSPLDAQQTTDSLVLHRVTSQAITRLRRVGNNAPEPDDLSRCFQVAYVHNRARSLSENRSRSEGKSF
jgi:hypothetical protein